jgi:hypothetical protein
MIPQSPQTRSNIIMPAYPQPPPTIITPYILTIQLLPHPHTYTIHNPAATSLPPIPILTSLLQENPLYSVILPTTITTSCDHIGFWTTWTIYFASHRSSLYQFSFLPTKSYLLSFLLLSHHPSSVGYNSSLPYSSSTSLFPLQPSHFPLQSSHLILCPPQLFNLHPLILILSLHPSLLNLKLSHLSTLPSLPS